MSDIPSQDNNLKQDLHELFHSEKLCCCYAEDAMKMYKEL